MYSLDQDGISLNTLYARCEPRIPSRAHPNPPKGGLLVIQDANEAVFGAWLSEGVKLEKGGYYGSGESSVLSCFLGTRLLTDPTRTRDRFLWRYHPSLDGERQGRLDVYTWTGTNEYVALCEPGFISFGGGCVMSFVSAPEMADSGTTEQGRSLWALPRRVPLGRLLGAVSDVWESAAVCARGQSQGGRVV